MGNSVPATPPACAAVASGPLPLAARLRVCSAYNKQVEVERDTASRAAYAKRVQADAAKVLRSVEAEVKNAENDGVEVNVELETVCGDVVAKLNATVPGVSFRCSVTSWDEYSKTDRIYARAVTYTT